MSILPRILCAQENRESVPTLELEPEVELKINKEFYSLFF